jgi:hypothetical protein
MRMRTQVSSATAASPQTKLQPTPLPIREMFRDAIEVFADWSVGQPEPTVAYENTDISLARACRLVWTCQNPLPGSCVASLTYGGIEPKANTYSAAAKAMMEAIKARTRL